MDLIAGRNPVREALRAGRRVVEVLVAEGAQDKGALAEIVELARSKGIPVARVPRGRLDEALGSRDHQGVVARAAPYRTRSWREGIEVAGARGEKPLLLALDGIEDPHNAGALLRSAYALGAHAAILPKRRSVPIGTGVAKAAAGALEHLIVDIVPNLERTLADCRASGIWVVALAADGDTELQACELLAEPVAIVVGSEAVGVSALIRKRADMTVSIPMPGGIDSLNASVAGAICLWEAARRRRAIEG